MFNMKSFCVLLLIVASMKYSNAQLVCTSIDVTAAGPILKEINDLRKRHEASALAYAAASPDVNIDDPNNYQEEFTGDNLGKMDPDYSSVIKNWYNEKKNYDFEKPVAADNNLHFVRLVWKETKNVECFDCLSSGAAQPEYLLCRFTPVVPETEMDGPALENNVSEDKSEHAAGQDGAPSGAALTGPGEETKSDFSSLEKIIRIFLIVIMIFIIICVIVAAIVSILVAVKVFTS